MPNIINYASERVTSVATELRFVLLPQGSRVPTQYTITAATAGTAVTGIAVDGASPVAKGATTITLATAVTLPARAKITFANGVQVRTVGAVSSSASLTVDPVKAAIPGSTVGTYNHGTLTLGSEYVKVSAIPTNIYPGEVLFFDPEGANTRVVVAEYAPAGTSVLEVLPIPAALTANDTATTIASLYIAGATDASPSSQPKTVDTANFLSGAGMEMATTGTNRTLNFTFQNIVGDPGSDLLKGILYDDAVYNREIYAILKRDAGNRLVAEQYEGAAIPTQGDQSSPVQDLVTITANLQFQGASFKYTPTTGAFTIGTGTYTPPGLAV